MLCGLGGITLLELSFSFEKSICNKRTLKPVEVQVGRSSR